MAKREWVVRVVLDVPADRPVLPAERSATFWFEQFRYAGLITWHHRDELKSTPEGKNYWHNLFDVYAPKGVDSRKWAEMNAQRMASFGINAVAAPQWAPIGTDEQILKRLEADRKQASERAHGAGS